MLWFKRKKKEPEEKKESVPVEKKRESYRILSIDGGGIRGIIPAMILAEVEKIAGAPISSLFDLIAGTSTGAILALGLCKPDSKGRPAYSAANLISFYEKNGKRIFSRSIFHRIQALGNIADEKYPPSGLEKVLDEYFGETRLSEALTEVLITSYEIERRSPLIFTSRTARDNTEGWQNLLMKIVVRGATAAPTYFEPLKIETGDSAGYYAVVDGGVIANNPAMYALVKAMKTRPDMNLKDFMVVSIGTGRVTRRLPYEEVRRWGVSRWAKPLLASVYDGVSQTVDYQMKTLLSEENYFRFQVRLDEENDELDNTSPKNIRDLKLLAEDLITRNKQILNKICNRLKEKAGRV